MMKISITIDKQKGVSNNVVTLIKYLIKERTKITKHKAKRKRRTHYVTTGYDSAG